MTSNRRIYPVMASIMIRPSTVADMPELLELYATAHKTMKETGNPHQWEKGYPAYELIDEDIQNGDSYVCTADGKTVAAFVLRYGPDPTYQTIYHGAWPDDKPYATIHRIASNGKTKGIFRHVIEFALQRYSVIRIDTHRDNKIMQHLIGKSGFEYCGVIHCRNGEERLAYQLNRIQT